MKEIKITFDFTMDDWMAFQKHYANTSKDFKQVKIISIIAFPAILALYSIWDYYFQKEMTYIWFAIFGISTLLWLYFFPRYLDRKTIKNAKKIIERWDNKSILWKQDMTLTEEYLFVKTAGTEQKVYWSKIYKIEENDEHIFIFLTTISAFIIPKEDIKEQLWSLLDFLKDKKIRNS